MNARQCAKIMDFIRTAKEEGATCVLGGDRIVENDLGKGNFIAPTVFIDVTPSMTLFREEVFGPVLAVSKADSFDHAIRLANDCQYGLSSSLYTANINNAFAAIRDIEAGITYINAPTIGA
ncbi:MAG: aldehyde dehydrogenase family protein, partial [Candidatus Kapaibacterium sp.]